MKTHLAMDVSKEEITFYADSPGEHYAVPNSFEDIQTFLKEQAFDPTETLVGCESTADYHIQPCLAALELGFQVKLLNPIRTKQYIKATIRNKKTDYSDAVIIAKLLKDNEGEFVTKEYFKRETRTMMRTERKITGCAADLKRVRRSLEVKAKSMDVTEALEAIDKCIETLEQEAKQLTETATENPDRQAELIDSIPGFSVKLSAIISNEAGDIARFPSATQFKAYVGIDPKVTQSGNSLHTGKITKRGNPILRHALYMGAAVARQYDPELKAFYEKKMSEGKHYKVAVCAVARKLCERIYAIVLRDIPYEIREPDLQVLTI